MAGVPRSRDVPQRARVRVAGTVQGVGFRPFVHRLASRLDLGGFVLNDNDGVVIEVEGRRRSIDDLVQRLRSEAPPLAAIDRVERVAISPRGERAFRIAPSADAGGAPAHVPADAATCPECLAELVDPNNRRHRYPFINCTNCGPRLTIVRGSPYDRARTTMASFEMCEACAAEYRDPANRRFDAQPNACPECGPTVALVDRAGRAVEPASEIDPVARAAAALREGRIVAVKGIGGYHLACLASDEAATAELRRRKHREDRPFAIMAPDLASVDRLVELEPDDRRLIATRARPIVVAPRRNGAAVAASVAPRSPELGVMLPYSPLHHLLLADATEPLVMTSGNLSDEPIAYRDEDALRRLGSIADLLLVGERPIATRVDDSAVRLRGAGPPLMIRRSRGYVPDAIALPLSAPPLLAVGAELKSTFCLASGRRARVSHHIGDLTGYETLVSFREGIERFERLFEIAPELVARDLHPDYLSSAVGLEREGVEHVAVQHHHAHLAACLAEHGESGPAIGAIYDGFGLGTDGTAWGGELLTGGLASFERAGHLLPVPLPGGDSAAREPWRMACAWLAAALDDAAPPLPARLAGEVDAGDWDAVATLAASELSASTTSVGRLFDAVAALCGLRARSSYEGQAAAELEWAADPRERGAHPLAVDEHDGRLVLDPREALREIVAELDARVAVERVAARFHNGLAESTARACALAAEGFGTGIVALSGGAFQNRLLVERTTEALGRRGLRALVPEHLPPNDGGISYGQAAVAAARDP